MGIVDQISPEERFWQWFSTNLDYINGVFECSEQKLNQHIPQTEIVELNTLFGEIRTRLHEVDDNLVFEFTVQTEGAREFAISADGIEAAFPAVKRVVAATPEMSGWKVVAFRQPCNPDIAIRLDGGREIAADDIWFLTQPRGQKVAVALFIRGLLPINEGQYQTAAAILLDNIVGEYNAITKIDELFCKPLLFDPESFGLKPLRELPQILDTLEG